MYVVCVHGLCTQTCLYACSRIAHFSCFDRGLIFLSKFFWAILRPPGCYLSTRSRIIAHIADLRLDILALIDFSKILNIDLLYFPAYTYLFYDISVCMAFNHFRSFESHHT